jgi:hypothetical protein
VIIAVVVITALLPLTGATPRSAGRFGATELTRVGDRVLRDAPMWTTAWSDHWFRGLNVPRTGNYHDSCGAWSWRRPGSVAHASSEGTTFMIILGVVLLVIGFIANISILWTIGIILVVVGAVLALVGRTGRKVGGRAHWY